MEKKPREHIRVLSKLFFDFIPPTDIYVEKLELNIPMSVLRFIHSALNFIFFKIQVLIHKYLYQVFIGQNNIIFFIMFKNRGTVTLIKLVSVDSHISAFLCVKFFFFLL